MIFLMQSVAPCQFHKTKQTKKQKQMKSVPHSEDNLKNNLLVHASKQSVMTYHK